MHLGRAEGGGVKGVIGEWDKSIVVKAGHAHTVAMKKCENETDSRVFAGRTRIKIAERAC